MQGAAFVEEVATNSVSGVAGSLLCAFMDYKRTLKAGELMIIFTAGFRSALAGNCYPCCAFLSFVNQD